MKVLILGSNGMLGRAIYHTLTETNTFKVFGTARKNFHNKNIYSFDAISDDLAPIIESISPDVVINCIGIIKQIQHKASIQQMIEINSLLPKALGLICLEKNIRLIHFSTDCIFNGKKGAYKDSDICDADDFYGQTKYLGEVGNKNTLTLRTSIIGHEVNSNLSLVDWFLSQDNEVKGYSNAIFSGFTTNELATIIIENILPKNISGIRNLSAHPISKYKLLKLIKNIYKKNINIIPCDKVQIDRSLVSDTLIKEINYERKEWELMIEEMNKFYNKYYV